MTETQLSPAAHERLKTELLQLTTEGRVSIARAIEAARMLGDLKENGDYHAAKDEQGRMEGRIRQLQAMLDGAIIVDDHAGGDTVVTGSIVTIRYDGDDEDETERYLIGSIEERPEGVSIMSPGSPLGQAVMDKKPGDVVEYEAPGGNLKVHILGIE
ncbi:MAG: GreA/GreB family elongation factor [Acidimicrobiales bacterium]